MRRTGALVRMSLKRKPKFRRRHNGRGNPGGLVPKMRLFNRVANVEFLVVVAIILHHQLRSAGGWLVAISLPVGDSDFDRGTLWS